LKSRPQSTNLTIKLSRLPGYVLRENYEMNEMGVACSIKGERRGVYRILVRKSEGKRPLGRPTRRWQDNIKVDLLEVGCEGTDWIDLAQDRDGWRALVRAVMYLRDP
jgi:hypothetical protein